jgi:hypothetical protein
VLPVRYELNLCYVEKSGPPPWSSGQSSWLHNGDVLSMFHKFRVMDEKK